MEAKAIREEGKHPICPPQRNPINGTFELTVRCNLHCKMCLFRHDDSENPELMARELTAEQWIDLARQAAEAGTFNLLITGGEPLLRPDFCQIWEGIYQQGFLITLYTNATLVTPQVMETLRRYPPHKIGVTIYGASPETYQKVCGSAQAFERMLDGVRQLQSLPSQMEFRTTIIKDNVDDLDTICSLVQEKFGSQYSVTQSLNVISSVRGACTDVNTCRLAPGENYKLALQRSMLEMKRQIGPEFNPSHVQLHIHDFAEQCQEYNKSKISLLGCDAGMSSYTISWDGKLLGCQLLETFFADAITLGFAKAWEQYPSTIHIPPLTEACQSCSLLNHCQSCYATRHAESGYINGHSNYICQDTYKIVYILNQLRRNPNGTNKLFNSLNDFYLAPE